MFAIAAVLICLAIGCLISLVSLWRQDMLVSSKLDERQKVYQELQDKRLSILRDTNKLKNDKEYQRKTLKDEFGYVEENEVPIVTVGPDGEPKEPAKK